MPVSLLSDTTNTQVTASFQNASEGPKPFLCIYTCIFNLYLKKNKKVQCREGRCVCTPVPRLQKIMGEHLLH